MAKDKISPNDIWTILVLDLLDQDLAQGNFVPVDAAYLEKLNSLVGDVSINMDERLPPEEGSNGSQDGGALNELQADD